MKMHVPVIALAFLILIGCGTAGTESPTDASSDEAPSYDAFAAPDRVQIDGYAGDAMEPFLSRDGRYLFFNNRNDPSVDTDIFVAVRRDSLTFESLGPLSDVNSNALDGVPTMNETGLFYFVSTRSYDDTFSTLYQGRFEDGSVSDVRLVPGVSREEPGIVNFDVEVSPDGATLYFVDARFGEDGPETADLVIARCSGDTFERAPDSDALLQNVNTDALEYAAAISTDGRELFFNRVASITSGDDPAIYRSVRNDVTEPFETPQRVSAMSGFVEGPTFSADDRAVYYHRREGDRFVLYRATR